MNLFLTIHAIGMAYYEVYVLMPSHVTAGWITKQKASDRYNCFYCDGHSIARCTALSRKGARGWIEQVALHPPAPAAPVSAERFKVAKALAKA